MNVLPTSLFPPHPVQGSNSAVRSAPTLLAMIYLAASHKDLARFVVGTLVRLRCVLRGLTETQEPAYLLEEGEDAAHKVCNARGVGDSGHCHCYYGC